MAIFSGKIIEAYYTDPDNTAVEVIYQDGKRAMNHYLAVDMSHPDFQDLIQEYSMSKIEDTTIARNKQIQSQLNRVVEGRMAAKKQESLQNKTANIDSVVDFVINYKLEDHGDELFDLKLRVFELPQVKQSDNNEVKGKIRQASTPLDVLIAYNDIAKSSK
jgi:hypothetical protein